MIYFDHNATTPLMPAARQAWLEAAEQYIGNPSSPHRLGTRAERGLNLAREQLAGYLGCDPLDIVWTSGATESNNLVMYHCARSLPADREIWISAIEHPCVLEAARNHFPERHRLIPVSHEGAVDLDWMKREWNRHRPGLIGVMAANNETGVLQPWREVLAFCREKGIPFFCDAAQWIGKLPAQGLGECDFVSGCAHKFGGPKGVGFLKCPARGRVFAQILGGQQEAGRRAGTENVPGVISMAAALQERETELARGEPEKRLAWRRQFAGRLLVTLSGSEIVGEGAPVLWNTVSALMPDMGCRQRWVVKLDKLGFAVSTGSACASGKEESSHVLAAMGYPAAATDRVLRFSSGWETTEKEWENLLAGLRQAHRQLTG